MSLTANAAIRWRRVSELIGCLMLAACAQTPTPELALYNGVVHTLDPASSQATAVSIRDGRIVCVGDDGACGEGVRQIDLQGRTVVPGLADSHAHLSGIGFREMTLDLSDIGSLAELQARVAECSAAAEPDEWIVGRGWIEARWDPPAFPTKEDLDAAAPDNPVYLVRADGHAAVASSAALALAGAWIAQPRRPPEARYYAARTASRPGCCWTALKVC